MPYPRSSVVTLLAVVLVMILAAGCPVFIPIWPSDVADNANNDANDNGDDGSDEPSDPNDNGDDANANDNGPVEPPPDDPVEPQVGELTLDLGGGVSMELALIPTGTFLMGTESTAHTTLERSRPVHTVTIGRDFYIGRYEVTQAQWQAVMGDNPSGFSGDDLPVESVSWFEAVEFCETLSAATGYDIRLPTEAQWEYACRAGTTTAYSFGDDAAGLPDYAWYTDTGEFMTHEVGAKLPNFWNLFDMHGNALEWCEDVWHADYTDAPSDEAAWSTDGDPASRVLRGGGWYSPEHNLRSDYRFKYRADGRYHGIGFRVVAGS